MLRVGLLLLCLEPLVTPLVPILSGDATLLLTSLFNIFLYTSLHNSICTIPALQSPAVSEVSEQPPSVSISALRSSTPRKPHVLVLLRSFG